MSLTQPLDVRINMALLSMLTSRLTSTVAPTPVENSPQVLIFDRYLVLFCGCLELRMRHLRSQAWTCEVGGGIAQRMGDIRCLVRGIEWHTIGVIISDPEDKCRWAVSRVCEGKSVWPIITNPCLAIIGHCVHALSNEAKLLHIPTVVQFNAKY